MKSRPSTRVQSGRSTIRRWLSGAIGAPQSSLAMRQLLCEQLERRYAMHGDAWFDDAFQSSGRYEVRDNTKDTESGQYAPVRSFERSEYVSVSYTRYSSSSTRFERYSRSTTEDGSDNTGEARDDGNSSSLSDDLSDHDCFRMRAIGGLRGEGEGPGFARPGDRFDSGRMDNLRSDLGRDSGREMGRDIKQSNRFEERSAKPESKIESAQSASPGVNGQLESKVPVIGEPNGSLTHAAQDSVKPTVQDSAKPAINDGSLHVSRTIVVATIQIRTSLLNLLGNRDTGLSTRDSLVVLSDQSSAASMDLGSAATPGLNSNRVADAVVTGESDQVNLVSLSVDRLATRSLSTLATNDGLTNDGLATAVGASQRYVAASSLQTESESEGLLKQLRSVIERLAEEGQSDRPDALAGNRWQASISSSRADEFAQTSRKPMLVDDGMLELAAANDNLAASPSSHADSVELYAAGPQHSPLLASLELHREFDLAGRSAQVVEQVVELTHRIESTQFVAETPAHGSTPEIDLFSDTLDAPSSGSLWQRSLIPMSFLAIGGLLLRKKSRLHNYFTRKVINS